MNFEIYNPILEKGSCILRTFMKLMKKKSDVLEKELNQLAREMNYDSYKEIEVFERYLFNNGYKKVLGNNVLVRDLRIDNGKYAVFCFKDNYYHMFSIIDKVIYDKNDNCLNLYVISLYKKD